MTAKRDSVNGQCRELLAALRHIVKASDEKRNNSPDTLMNLHEVFDHGCKVAAPKYILKLADLKAKLVSSKKKLKKK